MFCKELSLVLQTYYHHFRISLCRAYAFQIPSGVLTCSLFCVVADTGLLYPFQVISGHLGWVRSIAVEPGNQWFVTGAGDRTIKVSTERDREIYIF